MIVRVATTEVLPAERGAFAVGQGVIAPVKRARQYALPVIEELVALYAGQAQAEKVQVGLEPFKITVGPGAQAIYSLIQAGAEDTQLASVGFAPVTFERQGTQVGFDVETLG